MNKKLLIILVFLLATTPVHAAQTLTLMLDWFPNIDHLPIYVAQQEGIFADAGLKVDILTPSDTTDALKLAAMHKVDIAVSYEPQAVAAASQKLPIVVVGRLVEHPLGVLLFLDGKGIYKPKDLEGLRIGYTVPGMEDILLKAFADKNDIKSYTPINVGFTIIPSLVSGKVDAIMGPYKNYEAVELKEKGYPASYFEPCKFGIPDYDELVFITGMQILKKNPSAIRAFIKAIEKAITITRQDPDKALATYFKAVPEADRSMESKAFDVTLPLYASTQTHDVARWQAFADFALASGLIQHPVKAAALIKNF
ncbi:MAG TPA: ABC transporter substrate-binding protein [Deltaproteobacteria bacterium]|nr:ABC transporter substrate-binding protein [Deltaproteobacteria bacterium]